ncbi:MAG: amidase family protein [Pseudomonadota bacterium]
MNSDRQDELIGLSAVEAASALAAGKVKPTELVDAAARRIEQVDPALNALPTLCLDRARDHAKRIEADKGLTWLGGLPLAIKDLNEVAGVRTTFGSPIFADHVPKQSQIEVERLERHGGIVIAKSNTPEFGAGAQTFNEVFGRTHNPWNTTKTCGGSSGGAAVALATGMVWLAQGSDLGGSLRTPASFCSVVGLRPTPGLVPYGPSPLPFDTLGVEGPMARSVADLALMLDAMVEDRNRGYLEAVNQTDPKTALPNGRVAYSDDLSIGPVDPAVASRTTESAGQVSDLGAELSGAIPSFAEARDSFQTLRAVRFATVLGETLNSHRERLKPDVVWNIEAGLKLSAQEIAEADLARGRLHHRMVRFFQHHDFLLCPTAIVPPFDIEMQSVDRLGDHVFETYIDWIGITFAITLTGCPALSLPCGFTGEGLPVGLQIVAPPFAEARLLAFAKLLEASLDVQPKTPIDPITP